MTTKAPSQYESGHCAIGRHDRCQGVYGRGTVCTCPHHAEPPPEPEPEPRGLRIGSLFSGYGGLEQGVQAVLGGTVAWHCEIDPGACKILAHRHPDVPNLGDISAVDWSAVEPVDVLVGGFPCQDVSAAGKRAGIQPGTRSGLWAQFAHAINHLRPALVVIENVRGLCSADAHHPAHSDLEPCPWCVGDDEPVLLRALGAVLGDLADLGFDAEWVGLRAADVGAPHGRFRVFVVAWPADTSSDAGRLAHGDGGPAGADAAELGRRPARGDDRVRAARLVTGDVAAADTGRLRGQSGRVAAPGEATGGGPLAIPGLRGGVGATAHTQGDGRHEGRAEPARLVGGPDAALSGDAAPHTDGDALRQQPVAVAGCGGAAVAGHAGAQADADAAGAGRRRQSRQDVEHDGPQPAHAGAPRGAALDWGDYEPAIRRWKRSLGRPAPSPTERGRNGQPRLSPVFVEWLMGLPAGWVTDVPGITRNEALKALGNGVVPQQAAAALRTLLSVVAAVAS